MQHSRLPPEAFKRAIGYLRSDPNALLICAHVCKSWASIARSHTFNAIHCVCFNPSRPGVYKFPSEYPSTWASRRRSLSLAKLITSDLCTFRSSICTVVIYGRWPQASSRIKLSPDAIQKDLQDWLDELLAAFACLTNVETLHLEQFEHCPVLTDSGLLFSSAFSSITTLIFHYCSSWDNRSLLEFVLLFPRLTTLHCPSIHHLRRAATQYPLDHLPSIPSAYPLHTITVAHKSPVLYALRPLMPRVKNLIFDSSFHPEFTAQDVDAALHLCGPSLEKLTLLWEELFSHDPMTTMDLSQNTNLTTLQFVTEFSLKIPCRLNMNSIIASLPFVSTKPVLLAFVFLFPIFPNGDKYKKIGKHRTVTSIFNWAEIDQAVKDRASQLTEGEETMPKKFRIEITFSEEEKDWASEQLANGASQRAIQKLMPYCQGRGILRVSYNHDLKRKPRYSLDGKVLKGSLTSERP